ncbi:MAG: asparagine synthase-related protein [Acidobacteriota bacterium]
MALIAGYVAGRPQSTAAIRERVRTFAILPGEPATGFEQVVIAMPFGHLIVKHKATYPIKPRAACDAAGNALVTLGFMLPVQDAGALLLRSTRRGAGSLEECEGEFVVVYADAATRTVHIVNDRFSSRPFYTLRRGDATYFSSNLAFLLSLAETSHRPDAIGWLEASTAGHTLGTRTTVEGVERLRPATHLTVTCEKVGERQYWRLAHRPDPGLDAVAHSAAVFQAFRQGLEQRARLVARGVLALSGGLDSRLVAGAMPPDADYSAFTFVDVAGVESTPQTRAASAVCAALELRHHIEPIPPRFAQPAEVIALTGGMRPYQHMAIVMAYIDEIRRQGAAVLLGGGPGDVLAGSYVPSPADLDPARVDERIAAAVRRCLEPSGYWNLVFRADVIDSTRRSVQDAIAESFASIDGLTAAHRITAWAMVYRQPAFTFTSVLHTHPEVTEATAHLDYRYTDLMLQLPASWLYQKAFYAYMIYTELPRLRHIPYANTGALLSGRPPREMPRQRPGQQMWQFAQSFGSRAVGRVRRSIARRPAPPSLYFRDEALLDQVTEYVHSIPMLREIVDVPRCDRLIAKTRAGECPSEELLGCLTSLSLSVALLSSR